MNFTINKKKLLVKDFNFRKSFLINSGIKDYSINIYNDSVNSIKKEVVKNKIAIIDKFIFDKYFSDLNNKKRILVIKSSEKIKTIETSNHIINFFIKENVTKSDCIYAIGGGIIQDLVGYSCYVYKRGIPWIYVPTTMLGMTDSCVGGKVALNYKNKKNLCALFSAPKSVIISLNFLDTLKDKHYLSGIGEAFRLHITGGSTSFELFNKNINRILYRNKLAIKKMIFRSLMIKKAVVEYDEYENDIRRSMNFGHSIGHAYEPLLDYKIPHGLAVSLGICLELIILKKLVSQKMLDEILISFKKFFPSKYLKYLRNIKLDDINSYLISDKKTLGNIIKIAVPIRFGNMHFISKKLDQNLIKQISLANTSLLSIFK